QQPDRVGRPGRHDDGETRYVREDGLAGLRVPDGPTAHVAADSDAKHHRASEGAVRTPADGGRLTLDLMHGGPDVVEELHLGHRPQAPQTLADSPPDDVGLGQRGVVAAGQAETSLEAERRAEYPALAFDVGQDGFPGVGDVLAENPDALILFHLLVQGPFDGLAE